MRAQRSQLVNAWDTETSHSNSSLILDVWTQILPISKVDTLRNGISHTGQKSCLSLQVMVTEVFTEVVYQKFPQINASCLFFIAHPMLRFQTAGPKRALTVFNSKDLHVFMLRSLRDCYIHFTGVQNKMSAFETKPSEANISFNKAGFGSLVQCCMFNSTLDSDFYSVVLQSEDLQDKLFSVWFAGHCSFLLFCEPSPNARKSRNTSEPSA